MCTDIDIAGGRGADGHVAVACQFLGLQVMSPILDDPSQGLVAYEQAPQ